VSADSMDGQLAVLRAMAGLINHMVSSDNEPTEDELIHVADKLMDCHEAIHTKWMEISDDHESEIAELKTELVAVKASKVPPGSLADVEWVNANRSLLVSAAKTVIDAMQKDEPGVSGSRSSDLT
jgi:hypothetical protein